MRQTRREVGTQSLRSRESSQHHRCSSRLKIAGLPAVARRYERMSSTRICLPSFFDEVLVGGHPTCRHGGTDGLHSTLHRSAHTPATSSLSSLRRNHCAGLSLRRWRRNLYRRFHGFHYGFHDSDAAYCERHPVGDSTVHLRHPLQYGGCRVELLVSADRFL